MAPYEKKNTFGVAMGPRDQWDQSTHLFNIFFCLFETKHGA